MSGDATGLFRVEHPNLLIARSRATLEHVGKIPNGRLVNAKVFVSRNPKFNALAHAVFAKIGEATGFSIEAVKYNLKVATGRVDYLQLPNGERVACPQSLSFSAMGEEEFRQFWEEALVYIFQDILPQCPREVQREIEAMVIKEGSRDNARA